MTRSMLENCIYCPNPLNGSKEHIIPNSLNGRLTSKKIICSDCNNKFGINLDPILKNLFNPLILIFEESNAKGIHIEGLGKEKYVYNKDAEVYPIKDKVKITKKNGQTYLSASGNPKTAFKAFGKQYKKLLESGHKPLKCVVTDRPVGDEQLRFKHDVNVTPQIILALNKIATEFYAHCGLNIKLIDDLLVKVSKLDDSITNTTICNLLGELRPFNEEEISHILLLKTDESNNLICYIELYNVLCVTIKLVENYPESTYIPFYQDSITGEMIKKDIVFTKNFEYTNSVGGNFDYLYNSLFERLQEKKFRKAHQEGLSKIAKEHIVEYPNKEISSDNSRDILLHKLTEFTAELTLYEYPYMITEYNDEMNDAVNYIHSNLREEQFEEFCKKYNVFVGKYIKIKDDFYVFKSFIKSPFIKRNGIQLVRVFCHLLHRDTGEDVHILYKKFFDGIRIKC